MRKMWSLRLEEEAERTRSELRRAKARSALRLEAAQQRAALQARLVVLMGRMALPALRRLHELAEYLEPTEAEAELRARALSPPRYGPAPEPVQIEGRPAYYFPQMSSQPLSGQPLGAADDSDHECNQEGKPQ
jgi:hypothetical protein